MDHETAAVYDFWNAASCGEALYLPDSTKDEAFRVLRPGGTAKFMSYHKWSFVGLMLWVRYALLRLRPATPLVKIDKRHLESPGTRAYSVAEARQLVARFADIEISTGLTHADLLTSEAGQRHRGLLLSIARAIWPRRLIRGLFPKLGLFMITARKPA